MSTTFRPYAPDQMLLLPADLRAWLPEGHLAHHVSDLVDRGLLSVRPRPRIGCVRYRTSVLLDAVGRAVVGACCS